MWNRINSDSIMTENFAMYMLAAGFANTGTLYSSEFRALSSVIDCDLQIGGLNELQ